MRPANYGFDMPSEMQEAWDWVVAIDAWDYAHPELLAKLIATEHIPESLRPVISSIISGERKPNLKTAKKLKIPAEERMKIAGTVSCVLGLIDAIKFDSYCDITNSRGISGIAERKGLEPIEVKKDLEEEARNLILLAADEAKVSAETIENLVRDLRKKMKLWPNI